MRKVNINIWFTRLRKSFFAKSERYVWQWSAKRISILHRSHICRWGRYGTISLIHLRTNDRCRILFGRQWYNHFIFRILESCKFAAESQKHVAHGTVTVLCNNDFGHTVEVVTLFVGIYLVVFWAVDEANHIGILLDGSGFTEVA